MIHRRQLVAAPAFFLSGAAGLVYQVVWSRFLNEIFGVSAHATTAVLATYLGGLALGSWALGRFADRAKRPLRLYGVLELGIAAAALAGSWVLRAIDPVNTWVASRLPPDSVALMALRVLLASAVVLPPTILMGATLPAMTRGFVRRIGQLGRTLALLYGLNTAGAVAGSLAAGFVLIRAVGLHATLWVAVVVNVLVGVAALLVSVGEGGDAPASDATEPVLAPAEAPRRGRWILAAMALSGFASLSLEVLWTRMLVLVLGTSTYAFVTMLSSFLVGIALGSWASRLALDRASDPRRAFGWLQTAVAGSILATVPLIRAVISDGPRWTAALGLGPTAGQFALSFLVMLVPTTLVGATFPLAARIWARELGTIGGRLGQLYGANTLGNIFGALAGGFVLLPVFGIQRAIVLLVLANLGAAALALLPPRAEWHRPRTLLPSLPILGGLWAAAALVGLWHPGPLPSTGGAPSDPVLYYREGLVSTVSVFRRAEDGRQLLMNVDGVTIGQSATGVDRKQQFLAHAPFLLATRPLRNVLSIGLGTGILIGEVAKHPGVERVECVELSPAVIEGARLFAGHNGGVLEDPRVRIVNDDGVTFLRRSVATYDAIISDGKSKSGHAGNAVFYSLDYYRSARDHLASDGMMVQWVPLDVGADELRIIVRTFASAFPHAYLWLGPRSSFLVGLNEPLTIDLAHVQRVLDAPSTAGLRKHGWRDAAELPAFLLADRAALERWVGEGPVSSLEHPILEFYALDRLAPDEERVAANLAALAALRRDGVRDARFIGADERVAAAGRAVADLLDGLVLLTGADRDGIARLDAALRATPVASGVLHETAGNAFFEVARVLDLQGRLPEAAALYERASAAWPELPEAQVNLGRIASIQGRAEDAKARFRRALEINPLSGSAHRMLGELLVAQGDAAGAVPHLREAARLAPAMPDVHEDLGLSLAMTQRVDDALAEFREALRLAPDWPAALDRVALLLATRPEPRFRDPAEAIRLADRAVKLTSGKDPMALETAAAAYASAGRFDDAEGAERKVLDLAESSGNQALADEARVALEQYHRHKPMTLEVGAGVQ